MGVDNVFMTAVLKNSVIFLWTSSATVMGCWASCGTKINVAAQPLPTGDPGRPDFTENSSACPSLLTTHFVWGKNGDYYFRVILNQNAIAINDKITCVRVKKAFCDTSRLCIARFGIVLRASCESMEASLKSASIRVGNRTQCDKI